MASEVKVPRLGQGMETGTIVRWLKSEGEQVAKGEPLYELDTDKVTQEVEAEASGVLLKIAVDEGEVPVGRTIAVIGEQGEDVPEVAAEEVMEAPKEAAPAPAPMSRREAELQRTLEKRKAARQKQATLRQQRRVAATEESLRQAELEAKLANAQVIDPKLVDAEGRCVFGATVDVEDESGEASTWQIVGEDEADIKEGRISVASPIARALIGKESGESVEVQTPGGLKRYEIMDVRYE